MKNNVRHFTRNGVVLLAAFTMVATSALQASASSPTDSTSTTEAEAPTTTMGDGETTTTSPLTGVTTTLADSAGFDKEVVKHAVKVDADLIAIMNLQKNQLLGMFGSNHEQYMITNEAQIPVLIVNPIDATNSYQTIFT